MQYKVEISRVDGHGSSKDTSELNDLVWTNRDGLIVVEFRRVIAVLVTVDLTH